MNKPTVHYSQRLGPVILGRSCYIIPLDHKNHVKGQSVSNNRPAYTSTVVKINSDGFETLNTIYKEQPAVSTIG